MNPQPYNLSTHSHLLATGGTYSLLKQGNNFYLEKMNSYVPGNGFGKAVMRHAMTEVLKVNGTLTLNAVWSSHIFYLYMGMIPENRLINYVEEVYGPLAQKSLAHLELCQSETDLDDDYSGVLACILRKEQSYPKEKKIERKNIMEHHKLLLGLREREIPYLSNIFIRILLQHLLDNPRNKFPNTTSLMEVPMVLSPEGQKRWREAIEQNIEFISFRGFEPLLSSMTALQQKRLASFLSLRSQSLEQEAKINIIVQLIKKLNTSYSEKNTQEEVDQHYKNLLKEVENQAQNKVQVAEVSQALAQKKKEIGLHAQQRIEFIVKAQTIIKQAVHDLVSLKVSFFDENSSLKVVLHRDALLQQLQDISSKAQKQIETIPGTLIDEAGSKKTIEINLKAASQQERLKLLTAMEFDKHLTIFTNKAAEMERKQKSSLKYKEAATVANAFCQKLREAKNDFLSAVPLDKANFKASCQRAITAARSKLDAHREWKGAILKFFWVIIAFLSGGFTNDRWRYFGEPDAIIKLNTFEKVTNNIQLS